ncbi:MAG: hypothetical protein LBE89_04385 [Helicobacteraceae bacterium]|jgi:AmiR/NasT family two-component response regulator|nr:hypothetical protein [Helicobacteraceae bacterium]
MDIAQKSGIDDKNIQAVITARVEAILEAHANNLIEGLDMGEETLSAMLERAKEPISNEEFVRRSKELLQKRYGLTAN